MQENNVSTIVIKFGGTSVTTPERIATIYSVVNSKLNKNPIIVVSALRGVTDLLISLAGSLVDDRKTLINEVRKKHIDLIMQVLIEEKTQEKAVRYIDQKIEEITNLLQLKNRNVYFQEEMIAYGEILSSFIVATVLEEKGIKSEQVIATEIIVTDGNYTSAEFDVQLTTEKIEKIIIPLVKSKKVPVVTGFIGATKDGKTTTLGRGGSDYTASILGYCLNSQEIQIWTDVDGIYTADPRVVKKAQLISAISFKEASEMAFFGSKILHPRTIRPAIAKNIPVYVFNTLNPKAAGTTIKASIKHVYPITAISFKRNVTLVNMYATEMLFQKGFLVKIFEIYAKNNISVDLVSVSEVSISVTLDNIGNLPAVVKQLQEFTHVTVMHEKSIVSLIGDGITNSSETTKQIFDLLYKHDISVQMISFGATNINISFVIESEKLDDAVMVLHDQLLLKQRSK